MCGTSPDSILKDALIAAYLTQIKGNLGILQHTLLLYLFLIIVYIYKKFKKKI